MTIHRQKFLAIARASEGSTSSQMFPRRNDAIKPSPLAAATKNGQFYALALAQNERAADAAAAARVKKAKKAAAARHIIFRPRALNF